MIEPSRSSANGRTARHIGPLLADRADQALALVDAIVRSETGPWLIDAVHSQEEFLNGLVRIGLEHRAAVSAHALWPRSRRRPRNCRSPSPDRNLDRNSVHAS